MAEKGSKKDTYTKAIIAIAVLVVIWLILRRRQPQQVLGPAPTLNNFQAPYFTTNPGIPDNQFILNGGGPVFQGENTVNIQTEGLSALSRMYIPMFGLVGMTAVQG